MATPNYNSTFQPNGLVDIESGTISGQKKMRTLGLSRTILYLSLFDMFFIALYSFLFFWPLIFLGLFVWCGYKSAKMFDYRYTLGYAVYMVLYAAFKIYLISISPNAFYVIFNLISTVVTVYFMGVLYKYYRSLRTLTDNELQSLREGWVPHVVQTVYY